MNNEKLIFEIVAKSKGRAKGDLSEALLQQGFFGDSPLPQGLKQRHDLVTGNPIDIKKELREQNPDMPKLDTITKD